MTVSLQKAAFTALALSMFAGTPAVQAQEASSNDRRVEIGALKCTVVPNSRRNYIVRSTAQVDCEFTPLKGEKERYVGVTGIQLGMDLSVRENDVLRFGVLTSRKLDTPRPANSLAGKYFGATATASITYGFGASALVGGTRKEVSFVPVSIETVRGLGVSAGLGCLYLEPAPKS